MRNSKDGTENAEGRKLGGWLEERGWGILNGTMKGDERGEFTYTGARGETVIDYVVGEVGVVDRIESLEVGEGVESDHHPLIVRIREERREAKREEGNRGGTERGGWNERGRERFREKVAGIGEEKRLGLQEELQEGLRRLRRGLEEGGREKEKRRVGWWDAECRVAKGEARKALRRWRKGGAKVEEYRERKRQYKKKCEEKRKEEAERFIKEAEEVRNEKEVWEIVNRGRKRRKRINEKIEIKEWKQHFMRVLGGVERRVVRGQVGRRRGEERDEIAWKEVTKVLGKLRDNKAMGGDKIPNEVWRYGGMEVQGWAWGMINKVWRGEGWPEEWKEGVVVPIVKKGDGVGVEEYRGVTVMPTLYKVYASVLAERLVVEMEEGGMVQENQTGFRRGMGTMDNVYVLNYMINRRTEKTGGKMVALFIDLKAAFDSVDREVLWRAMEERGVSEDLRRRIEEIYAETRSRVRVGGEEGESFWTARGLRQGCPLSPHLFNVLTADLEEELRKGGWGE